MGFSFPQVHILHDRGLHIWEACNNVIIICLLYMRIKPTLADTFTPDHYPGAWCMEIFSCGRCFNGEKASVWQVLLLVCKSVTVCTSGHWPWWRLLTLGPDSGWSSWYWSRGEIRDSGWDGEPLWSFVPALWGVSQHPRMFSSWDSMMLSLIHRAGPRRLIGQRRTRALQGTWL